VPGSSRAGMTKPKVRFVRDEKQLQSELFPLNSSAASAAAVRSL
jgi:hypothetical protein